MQLCTDDHIRRRQEGGKRFETWALEMKVSLSYARVAYIWAEQSAT